jgi:hypothetical protein
VWASILAGVVGMKNGVEVTRRMQDADNLNAVWQGQIKNDVSAYRKTSQPFGHFLTQAPYKGPRRAKV